MLDSLYWPDKAADHGAGAGRLGSCGGKDWREMPGALSLGID